MGGRAYMTVGDRARAGARAGRRRRDRNREHRVPASPRESPARETGVGCRGDGWMTTSARKKDRNASTKAASSNIVGAFVRPALVIKS